MGQQLRIETPKYFYETRYIFYGQGLKFEKKIESHEKGVMPITTIEKT